jgi:hypothetical protein
MREEAAGDRGLLEAHFVEFDPLVEGFCGVLVELRRREDGAYVLYEAAALTGNRVLVFTTRSEDLAYATFERKANVRSTPP